MLGGVSRNPRKFRQLARCSIVPEILEAVFSQCGGRGNAGSPVYPDRRWPVCSRWRVAVCAGGSGKRGQYGDRRVHLNGHYTSCSAGQVIDLDAIVAGLDLG
jgi:hypothetical protein